MKGVMRLWPFTLPVRQGERKEGTVCPCACTCIFFLSCIFSLVVKVSSVMHEPPGSNRSIFCLPHSCFFLVHTLTHTHTHAYTQNVSYYAANTHNAVFSWLPSVLSEAQEFHVDSSCLHVRIIIVFSKYL